MKRDGIMDLKTTHLYHKFICIFLVCLMLVLGIQVAGTQKDSFFAFSKDEKQTVVIEEVKEKIKSICCNLKQYSDSYEEIQDKTNQLKNKKNYGEQYLIRPAAILRTNLFPAFQKADIRLWKPGRLTDAFTILYIHRQDGLKKRNPLF